MDPLSGFQRKYLRGLAHALKPVVLIGQQGLTDTLVASVDANLRHHELIKVHFNDFKEKPAKQQISQTLAQRTQAHLVGLIGHTAIFYRSHPKPDKRRIHLPQRPEGV